MYLKLTISNCTLFSNFILLLITFGLFHLSDVDWRKQLKSRQCNDIQFINWSYKSNLWQPLGNERGFLLICFFKISQQYSNFKSDRLYKQLQLRLNSMILDCFFGCCQCKCIIKYLSNIVLMKQFYFWLWKLLFLGKCSLQTTWISWSTKSNLWFNFLTNQRKLFS